MEDYLKGRGNNQQWQTKTDTKSRHTKAIKASKPLQQGAIWVRGMGVSSRRGSAE
jgi:hypothetical protein